MSSAEIRQGLINNLSAASAIGGCQVATNFKVLETTSACCGVVMFRSMTQTPWAMGNQWERMYTHRTNLFVKSQETNSETIEDEMQALIDTTVCSLESDRALQGDEDVRELISMAVEHDPETILVAAGHSWYAATVDTVTREWPTN